ncbi:MAG: hypothetical protein KHY89_08270 [Butyricicoccus pullicaecorum]|nr:hypothetical protein [Butyricicoccus pullicaecorum]
MDTSGISALLNDPKALEQALGAVGALLGSDNAQNQGIPQTTDYDPSADLMQRAMPVLSRIAQGGQNAVDPQKRALLNAIKPFVGETVAQQIDHGMRLVSLARMATALMNTPKEDSEHVQ